MPSSPGRWARARNGHSTEVNSPSGTSTTEPAGSDSATRPMRGEACGPMATRSAGTPTRAPKRARLVATASSTA
jgi:hypothetical protein